MNREETIKHFQENVVKPKMKCKLEELKKYCMENSENLVKQFVQALSSMCSKIKEMQDSNEKGKIAYITFSMLRTEILEKNYIYLVEAFNDMWFLDENACSGEYDVSWAFNCFDELEHELNEASPEYKGQIRKPDIEKILLKETKVINQVIVEIAKYAMTNEEALRLIESIQTDDNFEIRVGEYMDISEEVYVKEQNPEE